MPNYPWRTITITITITITVTIIFTITNMTIIDIVIYGWRERCSEGGPLPVNSEWLVKGL